MTFRNWLVIAGLMCGVTSANFLLTAIVVGKVVEELEKVKCRVDVARALIQNLHLTWTPQMMRMSALTSFIQEFIGRLEEESGIHSRIPKVFDPTLQEMIERQDDLFGPNQQVEIQRLEELYGTGPEDGPNG